MKEDWHNYVKDLDDPSSNPKILNNPNLKPKPDNQINPKKIAVIGNVLVLVPPLLCLAVDTYSRNTPGDHMGLVLYLWVAFFIFIVSIIYSIRQLRKLRTRKVPIHPLLRFFIILPIAVDIGIIIYLSVLWLHSLFS